MTSRTLVILAGAFAFAAALPPGASAETADATKPLVLAQGPQTEQDKEKEKAKRREERRAPPQGTPRQGPPPSGQPPGQPGKVQAPPAAPYGRSAQPPSDQAPPQDPRRVPRAQPSQPPPSSGRSAQPDKEPQQDRRRAPRAEPSTPPPGPPTSPRRVEPQPPRATQPLEPRTSPDGKREPWKRDAMPRQPGRPDGDGPKPIPGHGAMPPPHAGPAAVPGGPARVAPGQYGGPANTPPRFIDVQKGRKERVIGDRRVIEEPGNRTIIRQGNKVVIRHDETERFRRGGRDVKVERRANGHTETFYMRPDGVRVVTVVDGHGRMVRRYRHYHDGREVNIIDNRRFLRNVAIGVGVGAAVGLAIVALAPPRITIPREKYIVDYARASDDDLYEAFDAPPVERLERAYSLEEIRDSYELRRRMRYVELTDLSFPFGAWEITPDQYPKLERLARVILRVLERHPDEVFLIEGHTDAVGSDVDNLSLSDRRASAVAEVLSETFGAPPENLVTQGYGEQFLKVPAQGPEALNRRVEVRRIGPLMAER
jgi:outer membrane protein OmpA-like peptidoglycan-associated protein